MVKQSNQGNFDQILLDAIDETLCSLGESVKASIYFHCEDLFKIRKQDIPSRLIDFSRALEQIFGVGARHLEILFMKSLNARIKVTCKWPTYEWPLSKWIVTEMTFQEYVRLMKEDFEAANKNNLEMGILADEQEQELERQ